MKILSAFAAFLSLASAAVAVTRVLYIYGDVAADGTVPSVEMELFHQMRLSDDGKRGLSGFNAALEVMEFKVDEIYDQSFEISQSSLDPYRVLILGSNQRRFSEAEAEALAQWVQSGGGLIAWSDSAFGGNFQEVGLGNTAGLLSNNDLTLQFGMEFLRDNGAGVFTVKNYEFPHFLNKNEPDGGVVYRGEGVSCVRVQPPARMPAKLQAGDTGGQIRLHKDDGPLQAATDAALAVAEVGRGRVVGTFDRNTFWNDGEGTKLAEVDNREFAQRLVRWAAGE